MIKYNPLSTQPSTLEEFAEVVFTVRRISHGIRSEIRRELATALAKIRDKTDDITDMVDEGNFNDPAPETAQMIMDLGDAPLEALVDVPEPVVAPKTIEGRTFTKEQLRLIERISDVNNEIEIITANEVDPVYLKHSFVSMAGLEIDEGKPVTWQALLHRGPEELCQEVIRAIKTQAGLTVEIKENLKLPSTSGAQVDSANLNTSVQTVAPAIPSGTPIETVQSTSQAT